jgi:hypothetical protein
VQSLSTLASYLYVIFVDIILAAGGYQPPLVTHDETRIFQEAKRNPKALNITLEDKSAKENN